MPDFDLFAHYYDADMGDFADDLPLYHELARSADGAILDPMCGTGRVIVALAEAGHQCIGIDVSPAMIEIVDRKIERRELGTRLRAQQGDIRSFQIAERCGMIVVPMNSFMHLETVADQLAALRTLRDHLRLDGRLVLDLFNPDPRDLAADQGVLIHERTFSTADGAPVQKFVLRRTDFAEQTQAVEFVYDELRDDGSVRRRSLPFVMRWLYRFEIEHLLARAGFALDGLYGDYDLEPFSGDSSQMIVLARRVGR